MTEVEVEVESGIEGRGREELGQTVPDNLNSVVVVCEC